MELVNDTDNRTEHRSLSRRDVEAYERDGFLCPLTVLGQHEVAHYRALAEQFFLESSNRENADSTPLKKILRLMNSHLHHRWCYELATHPRVLDAVESVLGPNLLIWMTNWYPKYPGDETYITWHQDGLYWALQPPNVLTAWIALSESTEENGCLQVVPGSHNEQLPHVDTHAEGNLLLRGQEIAVDISGADVQSFVLDPGQMSLHHVGLAHSSKKNTTEASPRIGFAVRFASTGVSRDETRAEAGAAGTTAMLVRGVDEHKNFTLVAPPSAS